MKLPTLYHKGKQGEIRVWEIWTEDNIIYTKYGVLNGEMITSEGKKTFGKNSGKKNATTDIQQAELEAKSMWSFKKDRKYSENIEDASEPLLLPMLAKEYNPKKAQFPAFIQPKLDGVRCLAFWENDRIKLISRAGKEWEVAAHIADQVAKVLPKDSMFDGELYVHGHSCQTITSWVKRLRPETLKIEYHIYDMPIVNGDDSLTFLERNSFFESMCLQGDNLKGVQTIHISSEEDVKKYEQSFIDQGYEGAILRSGECKYLFGYRNADLMKIKTFKDAEFEVIDVRDGAGKFEGCAIFVCRNDLNDKTFECTVSCSTEEKKRQFSSKDSYIGRKLTVKFFDRTDDNLPRFPVGKLFRDSKDMG